MPVLGLVALVDRGHGHGAIARDEIAVETANEQRARTGRFVLETKDATVNHKLAHDIEVFTASIVPRTEIVLRARSTKRNVLDRMPCEACKRHAHDVAR